MCNKTKLKDFKGFAKLVKRIAKIDEDSAVWLIDHQSELNLDGRLDCLMRWGFTPQGHNHWENIDKKLEGEYND